MKLVAAQQLSALSQSSRLCPIWTDSEILAPRLAPKVERGPGALVRSLWRCTAKMLTETRSWGCAAPRQALSEWHTRDANAEVPVEAQRAIALGGPAAITRTHAWQAALKLIGAGSCGSEVPTVCGPSHANQRRSFEPFRDVSSPGVQDLDCRLACPQPYVPTKSTRRTRQGQAPIAGRDSCLAGLPGQVTSSTEAAGALSWVWVGPCGWTA
jgi:hypothetical protein